MMNTGISLFGGLLVVVAVFMIGRSLFKLPESLAALIAALLPLLGYVLSVVGGVWPGLDVLAIHIAVYLMTAFVLIVLARYRAAQNVRMHWAPKLLIGFFLLLILMNAGFLYVANHGLPPEIAARWLPEGERAHTGFSGVTRHGQDAAKAIGADMSREHRNRQLGWHVRVEGLSRVQPGQTTLQVSVDDGKQGVDGLAGSINLARPGAQATRYPLVPSGGGVYLGRPEFQGDGLWLVELEIGGYRQSWEINVSARLK